MLERERKGQKSLGRGYVKSLILFKMPPSASIRIDVGGYHSCLSRSIPGFESPIRNNVILYLLHVQIIITLVYVCTDICRSLPFCFQWTHLWSNARLLVTSTMHPISLRKLWYIFVLYWISSVITAIARKGPSVSSCTMHLYCLESWLWG